MHNSKNWYYDEENTPTKTDTYELKQMSLGEASGSMKESPLQNHFIQFSGSRAYNNNAYSGIGAHTTMSSGKFFDNNVPDRQQIDEMFEQAEKKEKLRNAPGFSISMVNASDNED